MHANTAGRQTGVGTDTPSQAGAPEPGTAVHACSPARAYLLTVMPESLVDHLISLRDPEYPAQDLPRMDGPVLRRILEEELARRGLPPLADGAR